MRQRAKVLYGSCGGWRSCGSGEAEGVQRQGGFLHAESSTVDVEGRLLARGSEQRCSSEVAWVGDDGERAAASRAAARERRRAGWRRRARVGELRGDGKRAVAS